MAVFGLIFALPVSAGMLSAFTDLFSSPASASEPHVVNSQNMPLLDPAASQISPGGDKLGGELVTSQVALLPEAGPLGTAVDIPTSTPPVDQITVYSVHDGESLSDIAKMFNVSVDTIRWANDLPVGAKVKPDQVLVILPISGVIHLVKKGDTIESIAKLYKADADDILSFNDLGGQTTLVPGDSIIVPDGRVVDPSKPKPKPKATVPSYAGYFIRPIKGGAHTQGIHGHNGVDLASSVGTPIMAAASGKVVISRTGGYNGGYGNYIVINHPNGTQTLYAHAQVLLVSEGQYVKQGQVIAKIGMTGRTTGPHVHFEIHGAKNPF